jgi:hypothetical protein
MATMNVSLPDSMKEFIEAQTAVEWNEGKDAVSPSSRC